MHQYNETLLAAHVIFALFLQVTPSTYSEAMGHFQKHEFQQASTGFEEAIKVESLGLPATQKLLSCFIATMGLIKLGAGSLPM